MTSFNHFKSVIRLNELAEEPYDLTDPLQLTPKRVDSMMSEGLGLIQKSPFQGLLLFVVHSSFLDAAVCGA